jgi:hypothetical protein
MSYDYSKVKLHVSTPCYGGMVSVEYMRSMCNLISSFSETGVNYSIHTLSNDSLVTRARACLLATFLADKDATHLMFVDADITFNPKSVYRLLSWDKPVVGGIYPMKSINWEALKSNLQANPGLSEDELIHKSANYVINVASNEVDRSKVGTVENGFLKVANIGTGFLLIQREAFEKMMEVYPEEKYVCDIRSFFDKPEQDHMWTFFDTLLHPKTKRYLSEDYAFCQKWIDCGGDVWADLMCPLHHRGTFVFKGSAIDYFRKDIQTDD